MLIDVKDFDYFFGDAVRQDVRQPHMRKLPGFRFAALTATIGKLLQRTDGITYLCNGGTRLAWVIFLKVLEDAL